MDWNFFFQQLATGINVDETCFYFRDDPGGKKHYLGYLPQYDKPYWAGDCDVEGGCEFKTAEELVNAPIFDGQSLIARWKSIVICSIEGLSCEVWMEAFEHA